MPPLRANFWSGGNSNAHLPEMPQTHLARVARHDNIVRALAHEAQSQGFTVYKERTVSHNNATLKPDLILHRGNSATIIDVTVPWETQTSLREAILGKIKKYSQLESTVLQMTGATTFSAHGLAIGARGAWTATNDATLKKCGIHMAKRKRQRLCGQTFKMTTKIVRHFMTSV